MKDIYDIELQRFEPKEAVAKSLREIAMDNRINLEKVEPVAIVIKKRRGWPVYFLKVARKETNND